MDGGEKPLVFTQLSCIFFGHIHNPIQVASTVTYRVASTVTWC